MGTRLLVEVLHEDGKTKFVRDATIADIEDSNLLADMALRVVTKEFIDSVKRAGELATQAIAPELVAKKLREEAERDMRLRQYLGGTQSRPSHIPPATPTRSP